MKPPVHPQRHSAGFAVLVSVLVLATFSLVLLMVLQQRRMAAERQVKQALQARLEREVAREVARLRRSGFGAPPGTAGAAGVARAIDNILGRSFDQMLALERRQAALRRQVRRTRNVAERRRTHLQLRQIGKELEIAKLWVMMLEDRRLAARRLEKLQGQGVDEPSPEPSGDPLDSAPPLPDWLGTR